MRRILPALLLLLALPAQAEIYKWVDERGRTHFGEAPPERYRKSATAVSPSPLNTIDGQALGKPTARQPAAAGAPAEAPAPPSIPESDAARCAREHARFSESQACFARFRNANGSLRAEASTQCEAIPQPTCDPQR